MNNDLFFSSSLWTTLQVGKEKMFVVSGLATTPCCQSVNCHVLWSPVPTARHLLVFLFAPLVRVIWVQRKNWCIAMFRLCSGQKQTNKIKQSSETKSLELLVIVGSSNEDRWLCSGWADEWLGGQRRLLSSLPAGHCLVLAPSHTVSAVTSAPFAQSPTRILTTDLWCV